MKSINEILKDYTLDETGVEEANAALAEAGAGYHLEPGRNELTEEERRETCVGYYPVKACGWGLLDTGTGSLDKVHVEGGQLDHAVNEVLEDGVVNMPAYVAICGKIYAVQGDRLTEVPEELPKQEQRPEKAYLRRRPDLAGRIVDQYTKSGTYRVTYDMQGYAVRAVRLGGQG